MLYLHFLKLQGYSKSLQLCSKGFTIKSCIVLFEYPCNILLLRVLFEALLSHLLLIYVESLEVGLHVYRKAFVKP